jgi:shikimate kinase
MWKTTANKDFRYLYSMRIFLIGFMGSGKSTVGERLAALEQLSFADLDQLIEKKEQKKISEIFSISGEQHFRILEEQMLNEWISQNQSGILACGGGTPCFGENMEKMRQNGITVYLEVDEENLAKRLHYDRESRPLLKNLSPDELLHDISKRLQSRLPFYRKAQISVNAIGTPDRVAVHIHQQLNTWRAQ